MYIYYLWLNVLQYVLVEGLFLEGKGLLLNDNSCMYTCLEKYMVEPVEDFGSFFPKVIKTLPINMCTYTL